ncbi:hypothetical protein KSP40_PGU014624 [Platanthera guangdongensis]|uniref:FAD-binding PCMH-type domain-containing protein n=1 Tax=Platanthera guangdongensis TaxID=2320717 RepID=A0ABR2LIH9_9ASPA
MDLHPISSFSSAFLPLLLLSFLFLPQHYISLAAINPAPLISTHESILPCLCHHSVPPNLLFFPNSDNFTAAFLTPQQNQRVISNSEDLKPFLIVTPTQESHAQAVVLCSRQLNLQLRTRSGGHDYEGLSYSSTLGPFLILDLLHLRSISFDLRRGRNTAWVQSGATLGELYFAIASKSRALAFPAGFCPTVGVGGHISGGGIGTLMRAHGIAADNVVDLLVIDAAGQLLQRESMGEDLFWALRGGGGASFGVIIAYKIKLVKIPPSVTVFVKSIDLSQGATRAVAQWQQVAYRADNRLYINAVLSVVNKTVEATFSSLFLGELKELLHIMNESLPELRVTAKDCKETTWIESQVTFSSFPLPDINGGPLSLLLDRSPAAISFSYKIKSDIVTEPIAGENWEKIWKYMIDGDVQAVQPTMLIEPLGGKVGEIAETETPFPHRNGSKFVIQYIDVWLEQGEKAAKKNVDWLRKFYRFMAPFVSKNPRGAYLNFRDLDLGRNRGGGRMMSYDSAKVWGRKYYKSNFQRLAFTKAKWDPENFFRNEQSIPPLF